MAITTTTRFTLPQWSEGADTYPGRIGWNDILALLENQAAKVFPSGTLTNRPAGGTFGRFYLATDQGDAGRLYYDGGTGWVEVNTNGGGGAGRPILIGGTGTEGTSNRSARGDHTHAIPLATRDNHGAMSAQFAQQLQDATYSPTANTMPIRNWRGAIQVVGEPFDQYDATSRTWVENTVGTSSATPNTLVRRWANGCFRAEDPQHAQDVVTRRYLDARGTWDKIANTFAYRGADGQFYVAEPTKADHVSTKRYVDSKASRREWKTNARPAPYGLPEILSLDTLLFDYRDEEDVPAEVRGTTDVIGAYVEDVAADMPLLAVAGEDGEPERIRDRDLVWPLVRAVQELAEENEGLREQARDLHHELAAIKHHLGL